MTAITEHAATSGEVANQQEPDAAIAIVRRYWKQLSALLPSHVRPEGWYSGVHAALYRNPQLLAHANVNPESLIFALYDAARQGLEPGTPEYYLTPRKNSNAKGQKEVLGMRGYQGEIELIYRAGAGVNVILSVVRRGEVFRFRRGRDRCPDHEIDWGTRKKERGEIYLAYAYCEMRDGSYSQVVVVDEDDIERAKRASGTANKAGNTSFWNDADDVEWMWLKTAVHRLAKLVPTSAEYVRINAEVRANAALTAAAAPRAIEGRVAGGQSPPAVTGTAAGQEDAAPAATADDPGELDLRQFAQPAPPEENETIAEEVPAPRPAPDDEAPAALVTVFDAPRARGDDPPATQPQTDAIGKILGRAKFTADEQRFPIVSRMAGRPQPVSSTKELTKPEASQVLGLLTEWADDGALPAQLGAVLAAAQAAYAPAPQELPRTGSAEWHEAGHPVRRDGRVTTIPVLLNGDCGSCEQAAAEGPDGGDQT